ncbi:MAG: septation ring formation regulator EzrA [Mycoplasmatales bacterium]
MKILPVILAIVILIIVLYVIRNVYLKKKRDKIYNELQAKINDIIKMQEDCAQYIKTCDSICKTEKSIVILNTWKKEYVDFEEKTESLIELNKELADSYAKNNHKDFLESVNLVESNISDLNERFFDLYKTLCDYTGYEFQNTEYSIKIKESIKETLKDFTNTLRMLGTFNDSFESNIASINVELQKFEETHKNGEYVSARNFLDIANNKLIAVKTNMEVILNMNQYISDMENEINALISSKEEITKKKFTLNIRGLEKSLKDLNQDKELLKLFVTGITFDEEISAELLAEKEEEFTTIENNLDTLKSRIAEQYEVIKEIIVLQDKNDALIKDGEELLVGALEEREEIELLYSNPNFKQLSALEKEDETFKKFKQDYLVLGEIIQGLKEDYPKIKKRLNQSNSYLQKNIQKINRVVEELRAIRIDELSARDNLNPYKRELIDVEMYIREYDHYYSMSNTLKSTLKNAYDVVDKLETTLQTTPINIEEVRHTNKIVHNLLNELITSAEKEIKLKEACIRLLKYCNRYIETNDDHTVMSHISLRYKNKEYAVVLGEIQRFLQTKLENVDFLYKRETEQVSVRSFKK